MNIPLPSFALSALPLQNEVHRCCCMSAGKLVRIGLLYFQVNPLSCGCMSYAN